MGQSGVSENTFLVPVAYLGGGPCGHGPPSESPKTFFDKIHC